MRRSSQVLWVLGSGLLVLVVIHACEDVSVVSVEVTSVSVSPAQETLFTGDTLRLVATPRAATGAPLQDRAVTWSSDDPAVASVTSAGLVQASAEGETRIRARAGEVEGSAVVTVAARPELELSVGEVRLEGMVGQGPTAPRTVQITANGGRSVSGLSAQAEYPPGSPGGWLDVTLQGSETPTSLVLRAVAGALSPGTYHANALVTAPAAANSPWVLPVEFSVSPPAPSIGLSSSAIGFVWEEGQSLPPPQSVSITNAGDGSLTGLAASVRYGQGEPTGWLSAQLSSTSAPSTLTLGVSPGSLSIGVYGAVVELSSPVAGNSPQELQARLTVGEPPPEIELVPGSVGWTVTEGQAVPEQRMIQVLNQGAGELTGISASLSYGPGQPGGWLDLALADTTAPTTLRLTLTTTDLLPGSYGADVSVASDEAVNSPQTAGVQLAVLPRVAPGQSEITADPEAIPADGVSTSLITVVLRDPRGDPIPFGGADVALQTTGGTLSEVADHDDGTYTALLTAPTVEGIGVVSGTVDGQTIGDNAAVRFVSDSGDDPVSPSLSSVNAAPSTGVAANGSDHSTVTIELRDTSDSPVGGLADNDFSVALSGNAVRTVVGETGTEGTYTFQVTNTTAETVTVTVIADGVTLNDQPTIGFVSDSGEDPVSASLSSVRAAPSTGVAANGSDHSTVTIELRDTSDNPVGGLADDDFSVALSGNAVRTVVGETDTEGTYAFQVTNTTAETVTVTVIADGVTLNDQPTIEFVSDSGDDPVSASLSTATASPDTAIVANGTAAFNVRLRIRDPDGDWVNGLQNDDFVIALGANAQASTVRTRNPPGAYEFDVTSTVAETVTIVVTVLGVTLNERPTVEFKAGSVSAQASSATADPSTGVTADDADASTVTVDLRDGHGNAIGGLDDDDFDIDESGDGDAGPVQESGTRGSYVFAVTNATAETVTVTIEADDVVLADRPTIQFVAGPVSGDDSSAWPEPSSGLVADGADASTVTVELEDANGNPVGGLDDDDFSIELTGDAVRTAVVQTDTTGTYTFQVTNTTAEEVTVTIAVHGSTVDDRPEINFDGETLR